MYVCMYSLSQQDFLESNRLGPLLTVKKRIFPFPQANGSIFLFVVFCLVTLVHTCSDFCLASSLFIGLMNSVSKWVSWDVSYMPLCHRAEEVADDLLEK